MQTSVKYDQFGRIIDNALPYSNVTKVSSLQQQQLKPHESIDKVEFAKQYHAHKRWVLDGCSPMSAPASIGEEHRLLFNTHKTESCPAQRPCAVLFPSAATSSKSLG